MADDADLAQCFIPEVDASEISKKFLKPSEEFCIDCGDDIPLVRQKLGGVERCIHCQTDFERYSKK